MRLNDIGDYSCSHGGHETFLCPLWAASPALNVPKDRGAFQVVVMSSMQCSLHANTAEVLGIDGT